MSYKKGDVAYVSATGRNPMANKQTWNTVWQCQKCGDDTHALYNVQVSMYRDLETGEIVRRETGECFYCHNADQQT